MINKMINRIVPLLCIAYILYSCDPPEKCKEYFLFNTASEEINVKFYSFGELTFTGFDTEINIDEDSEILHNVNCTFDGSTPDDFYYTGIDSVSISLNDVVRKTYYPDDEGRSIFKTQDPDSWEIVNSGNNFTKYVFFIREEDLNEE